MRQRQLATRNRRSGKRIVLAGVCRAILALLSALAASFASARAEESLSGFLIEAYWTEIHQHPGRLFPSKQNNRVSLFIVDPRRYMVELVRHWDESADNHRVKKAAGAFGVLEMYSNGQKLSVTRDGSRFTVLTYFSNYKYAVVLDVREKSCSADVSYQLDAGQIDYLMLGKRGSVANQWVHVSSITIPRSSCRVRDMNIG
jgi:hypothetical protein